MWCLSQTGSKQCCRLDFWKAAPHCHRPLQRAANKRSQGLVLCVTARGPKVTKAAGGIVVLDDLLNKFRQVPFILRTDILKSDEAIIAVFAHEMHEVDGMLPLLHQGELTIEQFNAHTSPANPGNLHYEARDIADRLVEEMRRKENDC